MSELAAEGTHLRYVQDLVARAYVAMGPNGSNDDEHDLLAQFLEYAEDDIRKMGGEMPTQSEAPVTMWNLLVINDGEREAEERFRTEGQAYEYLIREYRQHIDEWSDEDLDLDEVLGRVEAMYDDDKAAINEALASAGYDVYLDGPRTADTMRRIVHPTGVIEIVGTVAPDEDPNAGIATCGTCGRSWDDSRTTAWTPAPSGRCPFEYDHPTSKD